MAPDSSLTPLAIPDVYALAQALGVPVFESTWHMPNYPVGNEGAWRITRGAMGLDRGYASGPCLSAGSTALLRKNDDGGWDTWMSLSPFEIESQALACRYAHGHTVVMGLGMGWVAANMALNPAVTRITVIERDPDVLKLMARCAVLEGLPAQAAEKITLVQADALEWVPQAHSVDFLYADIWLGIAEPQALADVQRMQSNVQAQWIYFWGQELVLAQAAQAAFRTARWSDVLHRVVDASQLPLWTEVDGGFAHWVDRIWALRTGAALMPV